MNILILHGGALGDCVLMLHIGSALRRNGCSVTVAARSSIASWASDRGLIKAALPLDSLAPILWNSNHESDLPATLQSFDRVISFLGGLDDLGAHRVIAVDPRPTPQTLHQGLHITEQWARDLNDRRLIFSYDAQAPHLPGVDEHPNPTAPVLIHPGSGGREKCCPVEAMESLVQELQAQSFAVQWMIGPDEMERDGTQLLRRLQKTAEVRYEESVQKAADIVAQCRAFVGNDAGMTHVAALAGVNTVALFGPTDSRIWRPLGRAVHVRAFPRHDSLESWTRNILACLR